MSGADVVEVSWLELGEYARQSGKSVRTIRRWLAEGRLPAADLVAGRWLIPADAAPGPPAPAWSPGSAGAALAVVEPAPAAALAGQLWFTVDDLVTLWAPYVSRHAVLAMLHGGELTGSRRGPAGSWIIPRAEVARLAGR